MIFGVEGMEGLSVSLLTLNRKLILFYYHNLTLPQKSKKIIFKTKLDGNAF